MNINPTSNTNFQAKLVLGKSARPKNIQELHDTVRKFENVDSLLKGTFYVERDAKNSKVLNIFYKDGNYIDSCKYSEDAFLKEGKSEGVIPKDEPAWLRYDFISLLFKQREDFALKVGFKEKSALEYFNEGMKSFASHFGVKFEDLGAKRESVRVYPSFSKMEQEQEALIGKIK